MKTTQKTLAYDASILEAAAIMRYGYLRPVIDEKKCVYAGTRFINTATTHTPKSLNVCIVDKSAKGEFMYLAAAEEDNQYEIICHISVDHESIKTAFGAAWLTDDHLQAATRCLVHLAKCRFYYEYEYNRAPKLA